MNNNDNQTKCSYCGATDIYLNEKTGSLKCNYCRNEFSKEKNITMESETLKLQNNVTNSEMQSNNKKQNNKKIIVIAILVLMIIVGVILMFIFNKKEQETPQKDNINEEITLNTYQKLKEDYESGNIDVNQYFTQLVYYEYDYDKLNEKYVSDYEFYTTGCELDINNILEENYDELDKEIVKFYLTNKTLANVYLGEETEIKEQVNNNNLYEVKLLNNEELDDKLSNAYNHKLNKVKLSKDGNFLIWYTNIGEDAVTEEQVNNIANGLEKSIKEYEKLFNIEYSYDPYVDNKILNDDYKNAKELLEKNNISLKALNEAMSVYIYDTGSEGVLATYNDEEDGAKQINRSIYLDILDEDGVINYPYIVINKKGFNNDESLIQLYNHELFHHMQFLYCKNTTDERCVAQINLTEGMANFASAKVSNVLSTNNFLNGWSGIYSRNTSSKLSDLEDAGGSKGYGVFPYFYSYSNLVDNWLDVLMKAHNEINSYEYIHNNTSKENLISVINDLAYRTLTQDYDNKSLKSNKGIKIKANLREEQSYNFKVNAGAIDYFELSKTSDLKVSAKENEYLTFIVYGFKDGTYKELKKTNESIELDTAFYVKYDKFYLVVTNGDLINSYYYTVNVGTTDYEENSEFVTTFNNYNIEMEMDITIAGVNTNTVSEGVVDELHQKEYLDVTTTSMGFVSINNKVYSDFNTGYSYMTQPYGGDVWWKEKSASQVVDLGKILEKLISMKNVTKISDNHYKVKITKKDIKGLMSSGNADTSLLKGDIYVEVYTEDGYITKLEYDFTDMIKGFETFKTTIKYSNYDNAGDVEIPQSIIDNAQSY